MTATPHAASDQRRLASQLAETAAAALATSLGRAHEVAVIIGSGWSRAAEAIGPVLAEVNAADIPGMRAPGVQGHGSRVASVAIDEQRAALVFLGRTHLYEGHGPHAVAHIVRTAAAHGCHTVVLTNGCGAIKTAFAPGQVVLVADHINLTAQTALVGPEFVDLTDLYSSRLRALAKTVDPTLDEGVYAQFHGPQYETPAEIRLARTLGADLVGMSTAVEAVAAKAAGLEVLCLSLVTNMAAGVTGEPVSHAEVLAAGEAAADRLGSLLAGIVARVTKQA
ncbi:MAG: purine-nucleoside phosphorylase [Actinomycetales bacterium]|nr:purine-nucleoside phosphorylase [Actinomycetales bacterium]